MQPRKAATQEPARILAEDRKPRFQIEKLEERIAPHCGVHHKYMPSRHYRKCF